MAGVLYGLLVGSAALALWAHQVPGVLSPGLRRAAPWVFLAFALSFSVYRLILVRQGKYRTFKAFFQIAIALLFFALLLPDANLAGRSAEPPLVELLHDASPRVRALAAELARHRPEGAEYAPALVRSLKDPDEAVRREAHRSLVELTGADLGSPETREGLQAWEARYP